MKIVFIIILLICVCYVIIEKVFKKAILDKRKSRQDMFEILNFCNSYTEEDFKKITLEELEIRSKDNYKLKGYYYNKFKNGKKVIIIVHGYTANYYRSAQYIDMFVNKGFNILMIDVRSHGESEGVYATYGYKEKEDIDLWVNFIRKKIGENAFIGIHGHSMGAASTLMYLAIKENKINFVIAESSYSKGRDLILYKLKKFNLCKTFIYKLLNLKIKRKCGFSLDNINPIECVRKSNIPIMFIHGDKDDKIPFYMSKDMYEIKKDKKALFIVKNANHRNCYGISKDEYEKQVYEFLNTLNIQ